MRAGEQEKIFKALGEAGRLEIVNLLKKQEELSAGQILKEIEMGQSTLSHHMKILCKSGIVNFRKESRWVFYSINKEAAREISALISYWAE